MVDKVAGAAPPRDRTGGSDQRDLTQLLLLLTPAVLLLQRFWFVARIPWILPITGLALVIAFHRGSVILQRERLLAFLGFGSLALLATLIHGCLGDVFSAMSIAYLLAIYSAFVVIPTAGCDQLRLLRLWQSMSLICALLGILQFAVFLTTNQVLELGELLPPALVDTTLYNKVDFDPTHTFMRANGVVFLEPSFFSQFMALALVIEASFLRNPYRLGCFLTALLCAMSGTGMLMVCVALLISAVLYPAALLQRRVLLSLSLGSLAILTVIVVVPELRNYFVERITSSLTIEPRGTSAYIRFVAPWVAVYRMSEMGIAKALIGLGPGLAAVAQLRMPTDVTPNPITQVALNYGVATTIAFTVFIATVSLQRYTRPQWVVMLTVLFQYLFCSASLLAPCVTSVLLWFVLVFHPSPLPPVASSS